MSLTQWATHAMGTKVYVQTPGCQMNEYDSANMFDVLAASDESLNQPVARME